MAAKRTTTQQQNRSHRKKAPTPDVRTSADIRQASELRFLRSVVMPASTDIIHLASQGAADSTDGLIRARYLKLATSFQNWINGTGTLEDPRQETLPLEPAAMERAIGAGS